MSIIIVTGDPVTIVNQPIAIGPKEVVQQRYSPTVVLFPIQTPYPPNLAQPQQIRL